MPSEWKWRNFSKKSSIELSSFCGNGFISVKYYTTSRALAHKGIMVLGFQDAQKWKIIPSTTKQP